MHRIQGSLLVLRSANCTLSPLSAAVKPLRPPEDQEQHQHQELPAPPALQMPVELQAVQVLGVLQAHILVGQADFSKISSPWLQSK